MGIQRSGVDLPGPYNDTDYPPQRSRVSILPHRMHCCASSPPSHTSMQSKAARSRTMVQSVHTRNESVGALPVQR
jgi:hypothetical protein